MTRKSSLLKSFDCFFLSGFSFTDTDDSQGSRRTGADDSQGSKRREGTILLIPLYHFHPLTNIQTYICNFVRCKMRDVRWLFLIATLVFTRLLLDEIYHLIELPFDSLTDDATLVCLIDYLILGFSYSNLTRETGGFELASTFNIVLQSSQLTKFASHP